MKAFGWSLVAATIVACGPIQPAPVVPDGPVDPERSCSATCVEWRRLGCEEGTDTEAGASCEQVCENAAAATPSWDLTRDAECMSASRTCEAARSCR
jgi:hypothetical protein